AAAAVFGATQLGLGAFASAVVGWFPGVSPLGMGVTIGVCGVLTWAGRAIVVKWHGTPAPGTAQTAAP
ncbi:MAG TPA: Bcr/CflA family drug resistance efflux transporter, partial [Paraburkholderia sp.]|nr:Bcr/CflA family drug resistance efflux transporter [Paraburkholderia sp.]